MQPIVIVVVTAFAFAAGAAEKPRPADALFAAIRANDSEAVDRILAGDPGLASARDPDGFSAVAKAAFVRKGDGFVCTRDNPLLVAVLARSPTLDVFEAALVGDTVRVAALVDKNPKLVATRTPLGWTPLHYAAFGGKVEAAKLLLAKGAAIEARAKNEFNNTALQVALLCGEGAFVSYLLERGADPNVRQHLDFRPLHEAALLGRIDLIQLLLDHGAEVNPRTARGETPLATALRKGKADAVTYLRARGGTE